MKILIAGASGFVGTELVNALLPGHEISVLGRSKQVLQKHFPANVNQITWDKLSDVDAHQFDAIINLCGYNISASRWNNKIKQLIISSRVNTTTTLINWAKAQNAKPHFYCANAVGIYGLQNNDDQTHFDEDSVINFDHPADFMSEICVKWQQALQPAKDYGMQVTVLRFGVILKRGQGILKKLAPSFYFGLGSVIGDGRQSLSWIHLDDVIGVFLFLLNHSEVTGIFNVTSPNPVNQSEFAHTLATEMHRPVWFKTPSFVIHAVFGEMGDALLLRGQRVVAKRLLNVGYRFHFPTLKEALGNEFGENKPS